MFLQTYHLYQKYFPKIELSAFVSYPSHTDLKITEQSLPPFPSNRYLVNFIIKFLKLLSLKLLHLNFFSPEDIRFIDCLKKQDVIHFCGGGNLSSLFQSWLYLSAFTIITAKLLGKKIILTNQTIGPFKFRDLPFIIPILNLPEKIVIREPSSTLSRYGILIPKTSGAPDITCFLKNNPVKIQPKKHIRIGISIHNWGKYNKILIDSIAHSLNTVSRSKKIEILYLPHIITNVSDELDDSIFMAQLNRLFNPKIKIISLDLKNIIYPESKLAAKIKYLTSTCDLTISTRYHNLIFSLSENVPGITFTSESYYYQKNSNALKFYYPLSYGNYLVQLDRHPQKRDAFNTTLSKIITRIHSNQAEKKHLSKINKKLNLTAKTNLSNFLYSESA